MELARRLSLASVLLLLAAIPHWAAPAPALIRVLVVTGGHDFERDAFFQVFKDNRDITFREVAQPRAQAVLTPQAAAGYDVVVLYDSWQAIDAKARADFLDVLRAGKGLVAMHHCLGSYDEWDEFHQVIGGRFLHKDTTIDGKLWKKSTYEHGVRMHVKVADANHPVTRGVTDFDIVDETYGGVETQADSHPLLTTDQPGNMPAVCWWRRHGRARVVYLELGHDHQAYEHPSYRKLVANAIAWASGRD